MNELKQLAKQLAKADRLMIQEREGSIFLGDRYMMAKIPADLYEAVFRFVSPRFVEVLPVIGYRSNNSKELPERAADLDLFRIWCINNTDRLPDATVTQWWHERAPIGRAQKGTLYRVLLGIEPVEVASDYFNALQPLGGQWKAGKERDCTYFSADLEAGTVEAKICPAAYNHAHYWQLFDSFTACNEREDQP